MPRRTQIFQQIPWSGGINTSVDPGVLPPTDCTICDNAIYNSGGIKTIREGFAQFDSLSNIPSVITRSSSGTTRTLVFSATLSTGILEKLVVGEAITITSTAAGESAYTGTGKLVLTLATTNLSNDTITYTGVGSLSQSATATSTMTVARTYPLVNISDFWYFSGGQNVQQIVGVTQQPKVFKYDSAGRRTECTGSITARTGTAEKVNTVTFNNSLLIFMSRTGNIPLKWDGTTLSDLHATCPDASFGTVYLSKVWVNDKTDPDRLHYSSTGFFDEWLGLGDSGALDIRPGDGDPVGVSAAFGFKGRLIVAKKGRSYQIVGDDPALFQIVDFSAGLGIEAQNTVAPVDEDDVFYISNKGIHSIVTTQNFGSFVGEYKSKKIQPSFNNWELSRLPFTHSIYISTLNSIVFSIAEETTNSQDNLWLYDVVQKEWLRWPAVSCQAIGKISLSNRPILFIGLQDGSLARAQNGTNVDYVTQAIKYRLRTGVIYPDQSPMAEKGFKSISLFFRPETSFSIIVRAKIDNYQEQAVAFVAQALGDPLGTTFRLGSSVLGNSFQFAPYTAPVDGYGRGIILDMEQTGSNNRADIYGYAIEYEPADVAQETITRSSG